MSSRLIALNNAGALRSMFEVESIDSDEGVITGTGYNSGLNSLLVYANGAYNDNFGLQVAKKFFDKKNIKIVSVSRIKTEKKALITMDLQNLPSSYNAVFSIPKDL